MTGRAVFDVEAADNDSIQVVPYSSGKPRTISSHEFDRAEILGLAVPSVTPIQLRTAGASEFNPAPCRGNHPRRKRADAHSVMSTVFAERAGD